MTVNIFLFFSRYENHSPNTTGNSICNSSNPVVNNMQPSIVGRNNDSTNSPLNDEDNDNDCDQDDSQGVSRILLEK